MAKKELYLPPAGSPLSFTQGYQTGIARPTQLGTGSKRSVAPEARAYVRKGAKKNDKILQPYGPRANGVYAKNPEIEHMPHNHLSISPPIPYLHKDQPE